MRKSNIPAKERLIKLYAENTTYDLAKIFNVDRTTISNWLKKYNIEIRNKQNQRKKNKEIRLTHLQREFLLGTLLGDGHISITKSHELARFSISHNNKQIEYIKWKANILHNIERGIKNYTVVNKGNNKKYKICNLSTTATDDLLDLHRLFYNDKIKVIRDELIEQITSPFSLAIWIMDDGTLDKRSKRINICSDSFTHKEHILLKRMFLDNFNLNVKIVKYGNKYRLHFTVVETRKLVNIIKPFIIESMLYKVSV